MEYVYEREQEKFSSVSSTIIVFWALGKHIHDKNIMQI